MTLRGWLGCSPSAARQWHVQNVSDFLSSKAFMELASRFPVRKSPQPPVQQQQQQQQQHKQALGQLSQTTDRVTAEQMPTESGSAQVGPVLAGAAALETAGEQAQPRLDGRSCACINDVEDTVDWEAVRTAPHEKVGICRGPCSPCVSLPRLNVCTHVARMSRKGLHEQCPVPPGVLLEEHPGWPQQPMP